MPTSPRTVQRAREQAGRVQAAAQSPHGPSDHTDDVGLSGEYHIVLIALADPRVFP